MKDNCNENRENYNVLYENVFDKKTNVYLSIGYVKYYTNKMQEKRGELAKNKSKYPVIMKWTAVMARI